MKTISSILGSIIQLASILEIFMDGVAAGARMFRATAEDAETTLMKEMEEDQRLIDVELANSANASIISKIETKGKKKA